MNAVIVLIVGVLAAWIARWRARSRRLPARAVIVSPRRSSTMSGDGAVHSAQSAMLTVREADLEPLWNATNLENLARTYWQFLQRVTLGLIRVQYGPDERRVMLLIRPLTLLRFEAPDYRFEANHGNVSWRIRDGLLVARAGRGSGYLAIDIRRQPEEPAPEGWVQLLVEIEVANFYPSIAAGFSTYVYTATQSLVHVVVTHSFLRSLARLELAESKVGRLAAPPPAEAQATETPAQP
ncbi:MAG TPA: hypothetical protein VLP43_06810 [Solirubrobacteraceae bacterium]|nr:hypothetical protein [Solirubrobacteraceae bacterium]